MRAMSTLCPGTMAGAADGRTPPLLVRPVPGGAIQRFPGPFCEFSRASPYRTLGEMRRSEIPLQEDRDLSPGCPCTNKSPNLRSAMRSTRLKNRLRSTSSCIKHPLCRESRNAEEVRGILTFFPEKARCFFAQSNRADTIGQMSVCHCSDDAVDRLEGIGIVQELENAGRVINLFV
jgi:hypothetical protein